MRRGFQTLTKNTTLQKKQNIRNIIHRVKYIRTVIKMATSNQRF